MRESVLAHHRHDERIAAEQRQLLAEGGAGRRPAAATGTRLDAEVEDLVDSLAERVN